ncbi:MAG: type II secretion system protein [Candidatus Paceibacterota bacterium]|jgi:prepilin-type N-terminal cleavage/methylation domain-containing protein
MKIKRGYTLVELIIAVGLFALVMTLASGAYIVMIDLTRKAQGTATGIGSLSFALETMTRTIRTGTEYHCPAITGDDCSGGDSFSTRNSKGNVVSYELSGGSITQTQGSVSANLTDPSVTVSSLTFYVSGTSTGDSSQPYVVITVSGTVSSGHGDPQSFTVETGAAMRGIDL